MATVLATSCVPDRPHAADTTTIASVRTCRAHGREVRTRLRAGQLRVHLPPCYDQNPTGRFPLLILIHGAGADDTQWDDLGLFTTADRLMSVGESPPFVIATPRFGDVSSEFEATDLIDSVLPWIEGHLRVTHDAGHRSIGGISRGGVAALEAAARERFAAVGGHSAAVPTDTTRLTSGLASSRPRVWLDVGLDDPLKERVIVLARALDHARVITTLVTSPGGHNRAYWRRHLATYLDFYTANWWTG